MEGRLSIVVVKEGRAARSSPLIRLILRLVLLASLLLGLALGWPEPSAEHHCEDAAYGSVRVRAWAELHPKVCNHAAKGSRGPLPIVVGTLILVEVERLPRGERRREPRVLWLWWHGPEGTAPELDLLWRSYVRRFDLEHTFRFLKQSMGWTTP